MITEKKGWFKRLQEGLKKTSSQITSNITQVFTHKTLDEESLEELQDALIQADVGLETSQKLIEALKRQKFHQECTDTEIRTILAQEIEASLKKYEAAFPLPFPCKPFVLMMVGVNGSGKTTSIAKLAHFFQEHGLKIMLAAADTFRAAAIDQLDIWAQRLNIPIYTKPHGSDPAALCFEAFEKAKLENMDLLIIDTAGRLHTNANLMEELDKIRRVLQKIDPSAPHLTLIVLDATVGQNAYKQVEVYKEKAKIDGMILTKLDGTAKGGVVLGLTEKFDLPLYALSFGETKDDFRAFDAHSFSRALMGLS